MGHRILTGKAPSHCTTSQIFAKPDKTKDCPNSVSCNHMATAQEF